MSRLLFAVALVSALPSLTLAQSPSLVGTWAIEYSGGMRNENGVITPVVAKGKLTVAVAGDSLIGTLVTDSMPGSPARPPLRLATKRTEGPAVFVTKTEARLQSNGEESVRTAIMTWTLTAKDDTLSGSLERSIEGVEVQMGGPQPIKGSRVK